MICCLFNWVTDIINFSVNQGNGAVIRTLHLLLPHWKNGCRRKRRPILFVSSIVEILFPFIICHDEDDESNMETPCSCRGSLKYAHRMCVQRWCNEKGNIICEICHQDFKPGYTAPPHVFYNGGISSLMHFRGSWEMSRLNQHVPAEMLDHEYLDSAFDDFISPSPCSVLCCRIVAVMFIVLLVLRHTLPIIISGAGEFSLTLLMFLILRIVGILLPIYVMVRVFTSIRRRRHYQDPPHHLATSDDESDSTSPSQPRFFDLR
ncbi:uncharacterized protein LOC111492643 isoform X1 [Cucurbita maxima]|uniref:Uncharacterized protein LOC111492643 isoform X1 n=2 Tax=Cucurbita maxima TaxID=3661 RepID=A0A6J1K621_CUCMA|nr:uncharacterized protein LOC111492643 isoform X1 [Cucurbita maxima]